MKTSIYSQHEEHLDWLKKISFYNDELKIMQERLEEVNSKNSGMEVKKDIEHFQNQFLIQTKTMDDMKRSIKVDEKVIMANINQNPVAADHRTAEDHTEERENIESFENNFNKLRNEFKEFLAKRM